MFVIWGMRVLKHVLGTGQFHCPSCGGDTEYRHVHPRRWFTFFFIPVIPLNRLERFVECTRCGTAYREAVLGEPTTQLFEYQVGLAHRAAAAHLVATSDTGQAERDVVVAHLASAAGVERAYDADALARDTAAFADPAAAIAYVRPLATSMTIEGREEFLRRAATLGGRLDPTGHRSATVKAYGDALGLSPAHTAGILATLTRQDDAHPGGAA